MSTDPNPLYGLWCDTDRKWYGTAKTGALPALYSDSKMNGKPITGELQARAAATIMTARFKGKKRFLAKIYDGTAKRIRDTVTPPLTALQALQRIEGKIS